MGDILQKKLIFSDTKKSQRANTSEEGPEGDIYIYIHFQQPKVDVAAAIL
jgi:hypothetical protein